MCECEREDARDEAFVRGDIEKLVVASSRYGIGEAVACLDRLAACQSGWRKAKKMTAAKSKGL